MKRIIQIEEKLRSKLKINIDQPIPQRHLSEQLLVNKTMEHEKLGRRDCDGLEAPSVVVFAALILKRGKDGWKR